MYIKIFVANATYKTVVYYQVSICKVLLKQMYHNYNCQYHDCQKAYFARRHCAITIQILLYRHEIFPEFSGIPEFSRSRRSFSWKSQIRFNIYGGGGGGTIYCVCSLTVSNVGMARLISSLSTYFKY